MDWERERWIARERESDGLRVSEDQGSFQFNSCPTQIPQVNHSTAMSSNLQDILKDTKERTKRATSKKHNIGVIGVRAIAQALKINKSITNIVWEYSWCDLLKSDLLEDIWDKNNSKNFS